MGLDGNTRSLRFDPPKRERGFTSFFTADEVYANFDRYVKLFQEIFGK